MDYMLAGKKIRDIVSKGDGSRILAGVVDFLYENFDKYSWVGIYIVEGNDLLLGPWKGEQATEHTRIPIGRGICGSAAETGKTEIIADVSQDERYLSCFISTQSEIVVPIKKNDTVIGEIDIDSDIPNAFDKGDVVFLEKIADEISVFIS